MQTLWSSEERKTVQIRLAEAIVGSEATVRAGIERLTRETGADELVIATDTYEHSDRIESYRLVARAVDTIRVGEQAVESSLAIW
jgi:alkanesulfonate monooxygenase SsuD/methylene tetrahydromethanopterin reductase-like flavin-dependent oxidoreductase (luciferase family)